MVFIQAFTLSNYNIGSVIFTFNEVDRGFETCLGQTKDNKICICCFSAKPAVLKSKSKDWLALNQENVFEWSDIPADCCFKELAL